MGYLVDGDRLWLAVGTGSQRMRNLASEPAAVLVVDGGGGEDDVAVIVEGDAVVHTCPAAVQALEDRGHLRFGRDLDWAEHVIELLPSKVLSYGAG